MHPTPLDSVGVTEALGKLLRQDPSQYQHVMDGVAHYLREHKRAVSECPDPASVAHGFHRAMDQLIADATKQATISCAKGCAHCCYIEVHITDEEATLLNRMAEPLGVEIDWARVQHQARADRWRQLSYKDRRCVFLGKDNTCQVYEYRPMNCRKYMVASPAERCNSLKYPAGEIQLLTANRAEIMASALFSACGADTMSRQLLKTKEIANDHRPERAADAAHSGGPQAERLADAGAASDTAHPPAPLTR